MKKNELLKAQRERIIWVIPSTPKVTETSRVLVERLKKLGYFARLSTMLKSAPVDRTAAVVVVLDLWERDCLDSMPPLADTPVLLVRDFSDRKCERWMIRGILNKNCSNRQLKRAMDETLCLKVYPSAYPASASSAV